MDAARGITEKAVTEGMEFSAFGLDFAPSYLQAALIVFLLFVLLLTLARLRRLYVGWSLKGAWGMIGLGFFLALILEGFLIIGGRTMFTELLGWQDPPKPISNALDAGRGKLIGVLGVAEEVPASVANEGLQSAEVVEAFLSLPPGEAEKTKALICSPE